MNGVRFANVCVVMVGLCGCSQIETGDNQEVEPGLVSLEILTPQNGRYSPGDQIDVSLSISGLELVEPPAADYDDDEHMHSRSGQHDDEGEDSHEDAGHGDTTGDDSDDAGHDSADQGSVDTADDGQGHYHVYLDTEDDDAEHLTLWDLDFTYDLPEDIAEGEHYLRVSMRNNAHEAIGVEATLAFTVVAE